MLLFYKQYTDRQTDKFFDTIYGWVWIFSSIKICYLPTRFARRGIKAMVYFYWYYFKMNFGNTKWIGEKLNVLLFELWMNWSKIRWNICTIFLHRPLRPWLSLLFMLVLCSSVEPDTHKLLLRAQCGIKSGEEITIQYISFMYGNLRRKRDIR